MQIQHIHTFACFHLLYSVVQNVVILVFPSALRGDAKVQVIKTLTPYGKCTQKKVRFNLKDSSRVDYKNQLEGKNEKQLYEMKWETQKFPSQQFVPPVVTLGLFRNITNQVLRPFSAGLRATARVF